MRAPLVFAFAAGLVLISSCSRDASPPPAPAPPPVAAAAPVAPEQVFSVEEIQQLVAPIALYPDPLLAQVLMGSTYPGDVADAAAWAQAHPDATGDVAVMQVGKEPWDPSVQALVAFPQVLAMLGQDPVWVQRLGDAFLAQPEAVMNAVQRLRLKAMQAGNLATNEHQKVSSQPAAAPAGEGEAAQETVIIIEPSEPEVVYVPSYDPTVAYGDWDYPSYPPVYYPPPPYYYGGGALARGFLWGTGVAIANGLWGDMDWSGGDIDIDIDHYNNINVNNRINTGDRNWNHNSINRDGVPYRDKANRDRNGRQLAGASTRESFRGEDAGRAQARNQARTSMSDRGIAPATSNLDARQQARSAANQQPGVSDRSRDPSRDRAGAAASDQAARARSGEVSIPESPRDRQRAEAANRERAAMQERDRASERQRQQEQSNRAARDGARQQQQSRQSPRNDAFAGASRPSQSRQSQERGSRSRESASRPSSGRSSGNQVSRPSRGGGRGR